jgi:putative SOS response-associated peptidase YedK
VSRIFLTSLHSYAAVGFPDDRGEQLLATANLQPVKWRRAGKGKVPYRIALKTEEPFAFAGIWSTVHNAQGTVQPTFAILTTEANALVTQLHTRMPVIIREQHKEDWLNSRLSADEAQALLVPLPAELLMAYEGSPQVNSPAFNVPEAIQSVA